MNKQEEASNKTQQIKTCCDEENEAKNRHEQDDKENAATEWKKIQEKMDMELAAKYIQRKWNWYNTEGKLLAKKRKGKKGGKKGKKKK